MNGRWRPTEVVKPEVSRSQGEEVGDAYVD